MKPKEQPEKRLNLEKLKDDNTAVEFQARTGGRYWKIEQMFNVLGIIILFLKPERVPIKFRILE